MPVFRTCEKNMVIDSWAVARVTHIGRLNPLLWEPKSSPVKTPHSHVIIYRLSCEYAHSIVVH